MTVTAESIKNIKSNFLAASFHSMALLSLTANVSLSFLNNLFACFIDFRVFNISFSSFVCVDVSLSFLEIESVNPLKERLTRLVAISKESLLGKYAIETELLDGNLPFGTYSSELLNRSSLMYIKFLSTQLYSSLSLDDETLAFLFKHKTLLNICGNRSGLCPRKCIFNTMIEAPTLIETCAILNV